MVHEHTHLRHNPRHGWFQHSSRKDRRQTVIFGKNPQSKLKIIEPRKIVEECVGVFVSRFHPQTTSNDIIDTIREHTGITMNVEKLQSKYDTYYSIYWLLITIR